MPLCSNWMTLLSSSAASGLTCLTSEWHISWKFDNIWFNFNLILLTFFPLSGIKVCLSSFAITQSWSLWMKKERQWPSTATSTGWCWVRRRTWKCILKRGYRSKSYWNNETCPTTVIILSLTWWHLCLKLICFCYQRGNEMASVGWWLAGPSYIAERLPDSRRGLGIFQLYSPWGQIWHLWGCFCQICWRCCYVFHLKRFEETVS